MPNLCFNVMFYLSKWSEPSSKPGNTPLRNPLRAGVSRSPRGTKWVSYTVSKDGRTIIAECPNKGNKPKILPNIKLIELIN